MILDRWIDLDEEKTEPYDDINFTLVESDYERKAFRRLIEYRHQYKDFKDYPGRRIRWLIKGDGETVGAIGIASSPISIGDRDDYIGWNKEQKMNNLNKIADNHRFCLTKKGFGSQILSKFYTVAREEWEKQYDDKLVLLCTMVKPPWDGTVYKASGWEKVGMTKGANFKRPPSKAMLEQALDGSEGPAHKERAEAYLNKSLEDVEDKYTYMKFESDNSGTKKHIFVKPLHRYWKKELLKEENDDTNN